MKVYGGERENKIFPSVDNGVFILHTHPGTAQAVPRRVHMLRMR